MAKKSKKKKSVKVITKTKRVYVKAKRAGRRIAREAGERLTPMDIALSVAGASVGSIGGSIVLSKIPASVPDVAKNGILAAAGGFLAYKGLKKRNRLFLGLGLGAAAAGATNIIGGLISGNSGDTVNGCVGVPYDTLGVPYYGLAGETVGAPLAGEFTEGENEF